MFYSISSDTDDEGMMQGFAFDVRAVKKIKFGYGHRLYPASHPTAGPREKEPTEIIKLNLDEGADRAPLPSFLEQPVPLMRKDLLDTLRGQVSIISMPILRSCITLTAHLPKGNTLSLMLLA
ncbi:hypothetical protein [Colwellia psychrerythraea]|uniref:Uncharacterized protein n=1 Tax=Colwellia psychrerythraea TaxID=28229 RepID=A0A099KQW5_COLPS|nr:hypothetical protein [Colwellia psychrerythraea]KGJ92053.1 hypothetical protein GAB14E_2898 [Colwellia psychrerythraea]